MHLVWPIIDASGPLVPIPKGQWQIVRHPHSTVYLDCSVQDSLKDARHIELDQGYLFACSIRAVLIDLPGRVEHHQACSVYLSTAFGNPGLNQLPAPQCPIRRRLP